MNENEKEDYILCIDIEKRTKKEWEIIFKKWSDLMDIIYNEKDRNNALEWIDNPAQWMSDYNDYVFMAWVAFETKEPGREWDKDFEEYLK